MMRNGLPLRRNWPSATRKDAGGEEAACCAANADTANAARAVAILRTKEDLKFMRLTWISSTGASCSLPGYGLYFASQSEISCMTLRRCSHKLGKCGEPG